MSDFSRILILACLLVNICTQTFKSHQLLAGQSIRYGSLLRIKHRQFHHFFNSAGIRYNSGSHQQIVTGLNKGHQDGTLWVVKDRFGRNSKSVQDFVSCGDIIRLEHALTKRNLHMNVQASPISGNSQVSCFQKGQSGDEADDWVVECQGTLTLNKSFKLKHNVIGKYISMNPKFRFDQSNCGFQCAIMNELQVHGSGEGGQLSVESGVLIARVEKKQGQDSDL